MALFIKCVARTGRKTCFNAKRIPKLCEAFSTFPKYSRIHNRKPVYCSYLKKISMENVNKRNFSRNTNIVPFNLSDIGEGIKEVTIKEWFVKVGDKVSQFDNICEVQSDKASVTITSRYDGIIRKLHYDIDEIAVVGKALVDLETTEDSDDDDDENVHSAPPVQIQGTADDLLANKVLATPAVRRLTAEHKINLNAISGSGRNGRVLKEDVLAYLGEKENTVSVRDDDVEDRKTPVKVEVGVAKTETKLIQGVLKAMAKTMTIANTIPHFVYSDEIVVNELVHYCSQLKQHSKEVKITYMPFFIKAASKALEEFPIINSSVDEACERITYKSSHNIGVAMDTPSGLIVPNIKNVQSLNIIEIAKELNRLHKLGLVGALRPTDLTGGTFTLSNIGSIGGTYTQPVVLPPEVAIGGIGKIQAVPRYNENDDLVKMNILYMSWAADHRIIDGATMARFSNKWKYYIQNPMLTMINVS